jgi:hypothetical protein
LKSNEFRTEFLYYSIEVYTKHKHNMAFVTDAFSLVSLAARALVSSELNGNQYLGYSN